SFKRIPRIFFQLFVTKRQFAVFLVYRQDSYIYLITNFSEFAWVVVTFDPAQVADVDHTADTCFQLYEYAIRSDVFHRTCVAAVDWEFIFDSIPRIFSKLLDRQAHLTFVLIEGYYYCFMLFAHFEEFLRIDRL